MIATNLHEPYLTDVSIEEMTKECHEVFNNPNSTSRDCYTAALKLFKFYFAKSKAAWTLAKHTAPHPDFKNYVAMILNYGLWSSFIGVDAYNLLVKEYGTKPGIKEAAIYYTGA